MGRPAGSKNVQKDQNQEVRDPHKTGIEHSVEGRSPRVPMSAGGKLTVPDSLKEEGYQYYWAIDRPGDLDKFKAAWWEYALDHDNKKITTPAGKGETHYLMRIPQKYYDEDMANQQARVNDAMIESAKLKKENEEYVPDGHRSVLSRDVEGFD